MALFIKIPGNAKQQFQPFRLNPNVGQIHDDSQSCSSDAIQTFSFRKAENEYKLGICPNSFLQKMSQDLSYRLLFKRDNSSTIMLNQKIDVDTLFNALPGVKIREYTPDSPLNELVNFVTKLKSIVSENKVSTKDKDQHRAETGQPADITNEQPVEKSFAKKLEDAMIWLMQYITGEVKDGSPSLPKAVKSVIDSSIVTKASGKMTQSDYVNYVLNIPFMFYYTFVSCTTTNIYELPCKLQNDQIMMSDGTKGYGSTAIDLQKFIDMAGTGVVGKIADTYLGGIRMMYLSPWNATEGWQTSDDAISFTVHLFNDTVETTVANFVFVNTLVGNNKWIQYNFFQGGPSLYDVQIEGYNRLFACKGKFKVVGKGVHREPSWEFYKRLNGLKGAHADFDAYDFNRAKKIKIPDVYEVTLQFESCLPDNFNTWLMQYSNDSKIEDTKEVYTPNIVSKAITTVLTDVTNAIKEYWPSGNFPIKPTDDTSK